VSSEASIHPHQCPRLTVALLEVLRKAKSLKEGVVLSKIAEAVKPLYLGRRKVRQRADLRARASKPNTAPAQRGKGDYR
jgi:hypothetical protein